MPPQPRTSQCLERPRQYGPDPASAAAAYHMDEQSRQPPQNTTITSKPAPSQHRSFSNKSTGRGGGNTSHAWFDEANTAAREPQLSTDDEPPFHPRGSSSSDISSDTNVPSRQAVNRTVQHGNAIATEGTDSVLFRDIIDDLTIENRELKERVRRLEASMLRPAEVQQDQLFEVKVHGLPAHRKRQLVETLKTFAQEIDLQDNNQSSQHPAAGSPTPYVSVNRSVQPYGGMAKSPSDERLDSTHASASASCHVSTPTLDRKAKGSRKKQRQHLAEPLEGTPAGLLYKGYDPSMTAREKKIMVVKRLENIFSGKSGRHSRSVKSGPLLEGEADVKHIMDRMREAQILPSIEEANNDAVGQSAKTMLDDDNGSQHEGGLEQPEAPRLDSPQRETRPLDVDPNRVQNPQENIEYIRHLGMSMSPKLSGEETAKTGPILGWVYLNILLNLAQLHIFNVTPDFVRSAITEISTRFELSEDRQMVRWHSGPVGNKNSSDSEGDRVERGATTASSENSMKRQKLGDSTDAEDTSHPTNYGHSTTTTSSNRLGTARTRRRHDLEYKPLFVKPSKSSGHPHYPDDTASGYFHKSTIDGDAYSSAAGTMMTHASNVSHPRSDAGPIVFFSGAHFVTDLSGDPQDAIAQDQSRYYNHEVKKSSITPLGADRPKRPRQNLTRSHSGSRIRARPFKDYSKCAEVLELESRHKTPERICSDDANSNDISFDPKWTDDGKAASPQPRIVMEASGIGGTRPDDNFVVIVETAHPKMRSEFHKHLQAHVATALDPERRSAKLLHMIEEAKLGAQLSRQPKRKQPEGIDQERQKGPPVKITVLSKRELRLQPSETPPPAQLWGDDSDSDDESDVSMDSSDEGIQRLKISPPQTNVVALEAESDNDDNDANDNEDDDESIDMMGVDRIRNPQEVADREGTYERNLRLVGAGEIDENKSASSNATAGEEEDETSDAEDEEEEGDDSGDEDEDASMKG